MILANFRQYPGSYFQIVIVANANNHIDPTGILGRVIGDRIRVHHGVWHRDEFVVGSCKCCADQAYFIHSTGDTAGFDKITLGERAEQNQHDAGGKVGQGVFQSQANCQAGGTDNGHK